MDLWSLSKITCDEISTIRYLESVSAKEITCKFCTSNQFYPMKNKSRLRCKSCKRDFRSFKDSHFALLCIPYSKWLILIKLFEISASAKIAAEQTQLNYKTVLQAFDTFRRIILEHSNSEFRMFRGEIEVDEAYFGGKRKGNRGRGAENKIIVLGMLKRGGNVHVEIIPDASADTLLASITAVVEKGSTIYTDKWAGYNPLTMHGYKHQSVDHSKTFGQDEVHTNGIEGFWSFAKQKLSKHHGVSQDKFLLYIKEMEWRYNYRVCNLFTLLVKLMLGAVRG